MNKKDLKVSIVINVWNARKYLKDCLTSVFNQTYKNFEVIIIDNASKDGSPEYIEKNFPKVKLIKTDRDNGFARGNNIGIREATGDIICVICPDTVVEPNFLSECVRALKQKNIGMCSPKIKYYGTNKIWYAGGKIFGSKELLKQISIKCTMQIGKDSEDDEKYDTQREIDYATGCALFIKKEVIEKIGVLDERYFMYFEDSDWSLRASKAGYKIYYVPTTTVYHKVPLGRQGLNKQILHKYFIYTRSLLKFVNKHFSLKNKIIWILKLPITITLTVFIYLTKQKFQTQV